ncbi:MAG: PD40 domain-containing protein [Anaerolineales bacterium]|nr:PD40 domain-containing protein [Anaerolineales bacterium]
MMKIKMLTVLLWVILLSLTACVSTSSANATPTIVRLDRGELAEIATSTAEAAEPAATNTVAAASPTATNTSVAASPTIISASTTTAAQVTPTTTATATATVAAPTVQAEIVTSAVNLRAGPGMDYDTTGTVAQGQQLAVTGISPSKLWLQIVTPEGESGWITASTNYIRLIGGGVDDLPVIEAGATASGGVAPVAFTSSASDSAGQTATLTASDTSGGQLVFATSSGGDLYIVNADGTGLRKLASGVIDPVVSPDGDQVAYTRWESSGWGAVYAFSLDDGVERVVASDILQPKSPTWSPDGQTLVISFQHGGLRDPQQECRRYDFGERIRLPQGAQITSTSRNGDKGVTTICFIRAEDLQWYLRKIDVASGSFEDLPSDEYSFTPAWDPQSTGRVIYEGVKGLMQLDLTSGSNIPLTTDVGDTSPVFSPDGQTLALTYKQHDHWEVYTYNLASGARERLTKPPLLADPQYSSAAPAWSPDGSQIAFITDRSGQWEIWVMNADGSDLHPLFPTEAQAQLGLQYNGVNERLLNWVDSAAASAATAASSQSISAPAASTPAADSLPANTSLTGDWDFNFGTMSLDQGSASVDGTYSWYGGLDTGVIDGVVIEDLHQFQGLWISDRSSTSQQLLRWKIAPDYNSFTGDTAGGMTDQQWCGVRSGQPLPGGCGFSGVWQLHFASPREMTGQATLVQTGQTVQGTFVDSEGHTGEIEGIVTVDSTTEVKLSGTWRDDRGQEDTFDWRLDLTTGQTFQGRRDPGNSEWCGWREGTDQPEPCGWEN